MKSYAELYSISSNDLDLWTKAVTLVGRIPTSEIEGQHIRCHELAFVIGKKLDLSVEHGKYGSVQHSWLWTRPLTHAERIRWRRLGCVSEDRPRILDVYAPGQIPQVQLVDTHSFLPTRQMYKLSRILENGEMKLRETAIRELSRFLDG